MLVLSRKEEQAVHIGDDVTIYVGRISGNKVSLRIDAPMHVAIRRSELLPFEPALPPLAAVLPSSQFLGPALVG